MSIITLTTDFGQRDGYVGVMKGAILSIYPAAVLVDVTHEITPHGIAEAAFIIFCAYRYFPPSTVHLVVVDPGVGTRRRPIAVQTARGIFVAPDNGVLGYILDTERNWKAVHLNASSYWLPHVSHTFHGRDIFAPVAAHVAAGVPLDQLGTEIDDPVRRPFPKVIAQDEAHLLGSVLYVDRFGNLVTNLPADKVVGGRRVAELGERLRARIGPYVLHGLKRTYGDVAAGEPLLLIGSSDFVEIAVREGNAAATLGMRLGDEVLFEIVSSSPGDAHG